MIVVDASAAIEDGLGTARGQRVAEMLKGADGSAVPAHFEADAYGGLRRLYLHHDISSAELEVAARYLVAFPAQRYPLAPLMQIVVRLRDSVSAQDAFYVALAMTLRAPLLTLDRRLARAMPEGSVALLIDGPVRA